MLTHVVFGAGAVAALLPSLPADVRFLLSGASSVLVNFAIDAFGHTRLWDFGARSPLTPLNGTFLAVRAILLA